MSCITYSELTYDRKYEGVYVYPGWAVAIGWTMACVSVLSIPIVSIIKILHTLRRRKVRYITILVEIQGVPKVWKQIYFDLIPSIFFTSL